MEAAERTNHKRHTNLCSKELLSTPVITNTNAVIWRSAYNAARTIAVRYRLDGAVFAPTYMKAIGESSVIERLAKIISLPEILPISMRSQCTTKYAMKAAGRTAIHLSVTVA